MFSQVFVHSSRGRGDYPMVSGPWSLPGVPPMVLTKVLSSVLPGGGGPYPSPVIGLSCQGEGVPQKRIGVPLARIGYPHPLGQRASACCAADGTPLAVTQKYFLVPSILMSVSYCCPLL